MPQPNPIRKIIIAAVLLGIVITLFSIGAWIFRTGTLEVRVDNGTDGTEYTYQLINQKTKKTTTVKSKDDTIARRVSKGDYEVLVTQAGTSFLSITTTSGLLKTTSVQATLSPENARMFVGDEPQACMYYDGVLYSYDCNQEYTSLKKHLPATADLPTYVEQAPRDEHAFVKGLSMMNSKPYLLVFYNELDGLAVDGNTHQFESLNQDAQEYYVPKGLRAGTQYLATTYRDKPLLYTEDFSDIQQFSSLDGQGKKITLDKPSDAMNVPVSLSVYQDKIGVLYNSLGEEEEVSVDEEGNPTETPKGTSEFLLYENGKTTTYTFDTPYNGGSVCGAAALCLKLNGMLDIYDISGSEPKVMLSMIDVMETLSVGDQFIIATKQNIFSFDTTSRTGYIQYSYGTYHLCGLQPAGDQYLVCIVDTEGKSYALLINPNVEDNDAIDKKAQELRATVSDINSLSIYKNIIHVSPKTGEEVYSPEWRSYMPDPVQLAKANKAIDDGIDKVGIDRTKYQIRNIYAELFSQTPSAN